MFFGSLTGLVMLICAVWVIYDVLTNNKRLSQGAKIIWIVLALIGNILTAIAYYFIEKK